jgi:cob(I)alamin adenosyltransferase
MKITKVYTRRGDEGMTDLVGGIRIKKTDERLEAYGTVDELNSHMGLLLAMLDADFDEREMLLRVQRNLFNIGTYLATDQSRTPLYATAQLAEGETGLLEKRVDAIIAVLPESQGFVLPGGALASAQCHVCRTVCRRAERRILAFAEKGYVGPDIIQYVNRLSDYLFILAKKINFNTGHNEILWKNSCR